MSVLSYCKSVSMIFPTSRGRLILPWVAPGCRTASPRPRVEISVFYVSRGPPWSIRQDLKALLLPVIVLVCPPWLAANSEQIYSHVYDSILRHSPETLQVQNKRETMRLADRQTVRTACKLFTMRRCWAEGFLIRLLTPAHSARSKPAADLQCLSSCCVKAAIGGQTRGKSLQGSFRVFLNSELGPSLKRCALWHGVALRWPCGCLFWGCLQNSF